MVKIYIKTFLIALSFVLSKCVIAQQRPLYTQYMFNGLAINPAYAGSHESMSLTALGRQQWVGLEGAPSTQTFAAHTPMKNDRVGLGLLFSHDKIAVTHKSDVNLAYAYRIPVGKGKISLGIQAGVSNIKTAYSQLYLGPNVNDPAFSQDVNTWAPNIGGGIYYYSSRFYFGVSVPELLSKDFSGNMENSYIYDNRHCFVNTGIVIDLNNSFKLKPNALLKVVEGVPLQVDLNTNLLIKEVLWVGVSYRSFESVSGILELQLTDQFRLGYAYDFPGTSSLGRINSGSHEIMLNYSFTFYKSKFVSPRYF